MRSTKPRKMRKQFLVLCEGETEEAYVSFLRQRYRLPIKIVSKIVRGKISQRLIDRHKKGLYGKPSEIETFLMYDGDVLEVLNALERCNGTRLISKPCIEIWFLSHYKKAPEFNLTSDSCIKLLCAVDVWEQYKKGVLTVKQQDSLWDARMKAVLNMKQKSEVSRAFSSVYQFIEILETVKNEF